MFKNCWRNRVLPNYFIFFCNYSTPEQYTVVVRALFFKWPHLKKKTAILWGWCVDTLGRKAEDIFYNSRKRALNIPEIVGKEKQKLDTSNDKEQKTFTSFPRWGRQGNYARPFWAFEIKIKSFKRKTR